MQTILRLNLTDAMTRALLASCKEKILAYHDATDVNRANTLKLGPYAAKAMPDIVIPWETLKNPEELEDWIDNDDDRRDQA
jgi:hypothetical protein